MNNAKKIKTKYRQTAGVINALNYIWYNPDKALNLEILSKECNFSKFHFHRIFREYQGETLNEHISRKRLEFAANHLVMFPYISIKQIAFNLGFSSAANFSRAFKRYFGVTAKQWRCPSSIKNISEGTIKSKYGKSINPKMHYSNYRFLDTRKQEKRLHELNQIISFIQTDEQTLMYQTIKNSLDIDAASALWSTVLKWADSNLKDWEDKLFGIWYDNQNTCPTHLVRHDASILVPNTFHIPPPFMKQNIDAGIYATGTLSGSSDELTQAARDIYTFWFPRRRIVPDLKPYYVNYLNNPDEDGYFKIQFLIKLHPRFIKNISYTRKKF